MATTISSFRRLLRAASHRSIPTYLYSHNNLHRCHRTSVASFLYSQPSSVHISKPHFFSTSTSWRALQNPRSPCSISNPSKLHISNPQNFSTSTSQSVLPRDTTCQKAKVILLYVILPFVAYFGICTIALHIIEDKSGLGLEGIKVTESEEMKFTIRGAFPGLYRNGHSVVVEGFAEPSVVLGGRLARPVGHRCREYFLSFTEVIDNPERVDTAVERNRNIMAEKLKVAEELKLSTSYLKTANWVEQEAVVNWYTTSRDVITKSAAHLLKPKSKGMPYSTRIHKIPLSPELEINMIMMIKNTLVRFQGLSELLGEGDSIFIKVLEKEVFDHHITFTHNIKEDEWDEILEADKLVEILKEKSAVSMIVQSSEKVYLFSIELLPKHDEKYWPAT